MKYQFIEVGDFSAAEVALYYKADLLGRVAVCSSFDSGRFIEPTGSR